MRVDSLGPRTWLLAGAAAWGGVVLILALAGLGGRLGKADNAQDARKLPSTTLPAANRPGVLNQYAETSRRPLFSENRQPQPFTISGDGDQAQANTFDYTLTSVLITRTVQLAILKPATDGANPVRVKVGEPVETAPQWVLASLEPRLAVFRGPDGEKRLDLRVFDGMGGAAATPMAAGVPGQPVPGTQMPQPGVPPQVVQQAQAPDANGGIVPPPPPPPGPPSVPQVGGGNDGSANTQAQLDAIRKRIEERRAQMRQQAAQEANSPRQ